MCQCLDPFPTLTAQNLRPTPPVQITLEPVAKQDHQAGSPNRITLLVHSERELIGKLTVRKFIFSFENAVPRANRMAERARERVPVL